MWIKRALLLIILGLVIQLFCLSKITPGSFLLFAFGGVGLVGVGLLMFAWVGWRLNRARSGKGDAAT